MENIDQDMVRYLRKNPPIKICICDSLKAVLRVREQELLELKGPCSNSSCPLHYAHSGPCAPERL